MYLVMMVEVYKRCDASANRALVSMHVSPEAAPITGAPRAGARMRARCTAAARLRERVFGRATAARADTRRRGVMET